MSKEISTTKPCQFCGLGIPSRAIKCHECSAYQDWRHYMDFGATTLALIVALLSVLTVLANGYRAIPRSNVHIEVTNARTQETVMKTYKNGKEEAQSIDTFQVEAIITNSGNAPATVQSFFIANPAEYAQENKGNRQVGKASHDILGKWDKELDFDMFVYHTDSKGDGTKPGGLYTNFTSVIVPSGEAILVEAHAVLDNPKDVEKSVFKATIIDSKGTPHLYNSGVRKVSDLQTGRTKNSIQWVKESN